MHKASFMHAGANKIYAGQLYMNHVMRDPVCGVGNQVRLETACSECTNLVECIYFTFVAANSKYTLIGLRSVSFLLT